MTPNRRLAHNVRSARQDRSQIWRLARPRMALTGQWHQRKFDRWCHPLYAMKGTCRAGNASDYKIDGTRRHLISKKESLTTRSTVCIIYDLAFPETQKCQEIHAREPICYFVLQHRIKCLLVLEGSQRETMFVKGWLPQVSMLCGFPPPGMNAREALLPWLIFRKRPMHLAIVW